MRCPMKLDKIHCENCYFQKENLCDYPYHKNMSPGQIQRVSKMLALRGKIDE